jgi:hypothetical protein
MNILVKRKFKENPQMVVEVGVWKEYVQNRSLCKVL